MTVLAHRAAAFARAAIVIVALSLAACGGGGGGSGGGTPTTPTTPTTPSTPTGTVTWEWILQNPPATPPQVTYYDIDGFDVSAAYVAAAKARGDKVICYLSIGTAENFRPDYAQFAAIAGVLGNSYPGFSDERFLNVRNYTAFISIMDARLRMCRDKGFDYVEFDNMDTFGESAGVLGFSITQADMVAYVTELVNRTRGYGMQALQKNTPTLAATLQPIFGGIVMEGCVRENFCNSASVYVNAGKPALNAEYPSEYSPPSSFNQANVCAASATARVTTIITVVDLDRASTRC